jgi:hypothetical protein
MRGFGFVLPVVFVVSLSACSRTGLEFPGEVSDAGIVDVTNDGTTLPDVPLADVNVPDAPAGRETECADGRDNDGDGVFDCDDSDCSGVCNQFEFQCSDGIDDDQDGLTDCQDSDCQRRCVIGRTEFDCFDGFDNDQNGATDCADIQCVEACSQPTEFDCFNGFDDDNDGSADCEDADCADQCGEPQFEFDCFNGFDDDRDSLVDCEDRDCAEQCVVPDRESDCFDELDNDRDGATDCDDRDCRRQCGPGPVPGDGACANPQDTRWFNDNDPNDALNSCIEPCVERIEDECVGECMQEQGLTSDCAGCFDDLIICYAFECGDACQFDEDECNACFENQCLPPLRECSGLGF